MDTTSLPEQQLPTVRSLGHDLVRVVAVRTRSQLRRGRALLHAAAHAGAEAWRCAALVAVILGASMSLAWLVWDTTVEQRQGRAAEQRSAEDGLEGSLVDTDVLRELEVQRGDAPGQGVSGRGPSAADDAGTRPAGAPSTVGGWVLSVAAVSAVLAAGVGTAVVVVRRHRRRTEAPAAEQTPPAEWLPDPGVDKPVIEAEEQATELADATDEGETDNPLADALALDLVADDERATASMTSSPGTLPLWVDSGVAPTALSTASTALLVGEPLPSRFEAHQRLYERRTAPRVDYVHAGSLDWRGVHWDMTVRDLSGTGLRLRVTPGQDARLPAANDYVQVDFPVDGGRVHVAAQVAWRRSTPEGTEMGVVFRPLAVRDIELIRDTCLARL